MPNTSGAYPMPYPNSTAVPDVPGDVLLLAQATDTAFTAIAGIRRYANLAAINALASPRAHDRAVALDTGIEYRYSGSAWVTSGNVMHPSSVDNGTAAASGEITSASVALVRARGVFVAARFRRYEIAFDITCASSSALNAQLAVAATDTTVTYDNQRTTDIGATRAAVQSLSNANLIVSAIASTRHVGKITLANPNNVDQTYYLVDTVSSPSPMTSAYGKYEGSGLQRATTAFDGIHFSAGSGDITVNSLSITGVI